MDDLQGRVILKYKDTVRGPWQIPRWEVLSVGRTHGYGLHLPSSWVPSKLCRFLPWEQGWVVQVGPRPRMRVQDPYVGDHTFDRAALVALQEGECLLSFPELDDFVQLGVVIGPDAGAGLPLAEDDELVRDEFRSRTRYAVGNLNLTPNQRVVVAAAFAYLIKGESKSANVAAAAAAFTGKGEAAVVKTLIKVRDRVNAEKWGPKLESYEQLGHYLVHLTRSIGWADLPEQLQGSAD